MGIEKFFSTVNRNFQVVSTIDLENISSKTDLIHSKYLFIDFNSIIHNVSSKLIGELNQSHSSSTTKYSHVKLEDLDYLIIQEVNLFIIKLLEKINLKSLELVYAALDGVPTFAKILEQKKRRFMGDFVDKLLSRYSLPFNWSKNNISPGTIFMEKINQYLNNIKSITKNKLIKKEDLILKPSDYEFYSPSDGVYGNKVSYSKIKKFNFSDTNMEGEGEMKIYDIINNLQLKKDESILFYSPDADVILLSMVSKNSDNISILKYDQNLDEMFLINIKLLKDAIYSYCLERIEGSDYLEEYSELNMKKLIRDIVFVFTIFGNDFLPKCESVQTNLDFLFLIDMYLINLINNGYLISDGDIVNKSFFGYLQLMGTNEKRMLFRNSYLNIYQNYNYSNQKNFMIDLAKLKNTTNKGSSFEFSSKKFGDPFYNFTNNILFYIDPFKIQEYIFKHKNPKTKFHGCLEFYLLDRNTLIEVIKQSLQSILPINSLLNIELTDINENSPYEQLRFTKFNSKQKKHILNMKDLNPRDKEFYLINNKLDKYHTLFNPVNEFYSNILRTRRIDESYYYKKYFNQDDRKQAVNAYLKGIKWVFQYYFKRTNNNSNFDETWFYPYFKAPLFDTLVRYYLPSVVDYNPKPKKLEISPLEQLLYITPIRFSDLSAQKFYLMFAEFSDGKFSDEEFVKKIKLFIEKYPQFFYNLDEIYYSINTGSLNKNLFDCSNSVFISKCHYIILNYVVDINQFTLKLRNTLA
jgi:5'-3' exonuclease